MRFGISEFWTLSIVRYSKEDKVSKTESCLFSGEAPTVLAPLVRANHSRRIFSVFFADCIIRRSNFLQEGCAPGP
jgi:hypothetical protein